MITHKMTMLLRNSLISYIAKFSNPNFLKKRDNNTYHTIEQ